MMLHDGQSLEALGVPPGGVCRVAAVAPVIPVALPWAPGWLTYVRLTVDQQIEAATSDGVLIPLLCMGEGRTGHTHNILITQGT